MTEKAAPKLSPAKMKHHVFIDLIPFTKLSKAMKPKKVKKTFINPNLESTNKDPSKQKKRAVKTAKILLSTNSNDRR